MLVFAWPEKTNPDKCRICGHSSSMSVKRGVNPILNVNDHSLLSYVTKSPTTKMWRGLQSWDRRLKNVMAAAEVSNNLYLLEILNSIPWLRGNVTIWRAFNAKKTCFLCFFVFIFCPLRSSLICSPFNPAFPDPALAVTLRVWPTA